MRFFESPTRYRWLGWAALALVFLLVNVHRLSTAVLSEELTVDFAITAAQLGTLHASFFAVYAIIQIPTGAMADRWGPRYVGAFGAVLLSLSALAFTLSGGYLTAFLSRALLGLGSGVIFISILRFAASWYRANEFATMTGLTTGVAGLGAIVATTPLALSVDAIGWQASIQGLALFGLAAAAFVFIVVRRSPESAGFEPIENVPRQPSVSLRETGGHLKSLLRDRIQWLLSLMFFASMGTILTIIGLWGVPYLVVVYELPVTTASYYTLLGAIGMLIGAPMVGWISDRLERRKAPLVVGLALFTLALSVIPILGTPPLYAVGFVYFIIGFCVGFTVLILAIIKERYPPAASGVATATVNGAGFLGATVLPTAMGVALDSYRTGEVVAGTTAYTETGYRVAFAITAIAVACAFLCALWLTLNDDQSS